jgi:hypothetical protein
MYSFSFFVFPFLTLIGNLSLRIRFVHKKRQVDLRGSPLRLTHTGQKMWFYKCLLISNFKTKYLEVVILLARSANSH